MDIKSYLTAGKCTFTLLSTKLDKRYTYRIGRDNKNQQRYFVSVMFGSDNESDYRYIGLFYTDGEQPMSLRTSTAAHLPHTAPQFVMMQYFLNLIGRDMPWPETCKFFPSGKCARCGRLLTTPESIEVGIGPECLRKCI